MTGPIRTIGTRRALGRRRRSRRVRLGELDPRYLRNAEARTMAGFAQALFDATDGVVPTGDDHFAALWPEAIRISSGGLGARHCDQPWG